MAAPGKAPTISVRALRQPGGPSAAVLAIGGSIAPADILELCGRARLLLEGTECDLVICDVSALVGPDAAAVDALARLQLTARRLGRQICLVQVGDELRELLVLTGLREVFPNVAGLPLEPGGKTEQGKEGRGVEEEHDPGDLAP